VTKATADAQRLEIRRVRASDQAELGAFECSDDDLTSFLRDDALRMRFAADRADSIADSAGCRLPTVDAHPDAITFYESLGSLRNEAQPDREREHPSMRFDLFAPETPRTRKELPTRGFSSASKGGATARNHKWLKVLKGGV
jgi:hypothetical protein